MKAALCLLYLFPGVPCIFYGTEILTEGGYDPDCRRCMDWSKTDADEYKDIFRLLNKLAHIRRKYGISDSNVSIRGENEVLIVEHKTCENLVKLFINLTKKEKRIDTITIPSENHVICINEGVIDYE